MISEMTKPFIWLMVNLFLSIPPTNSDHQHINIFTDQFIFSSFSFFSFQLWINLLHISDSVCMPFVWGIVMKWTASNNNRKAHGFAEEEADRVSGHVYMYCISTGRILIKGIYVLQSILCKLKRMMFIVK